MEDQNLFSRQGGKYSESRPRWPDELFLTLSALCACRDLAWDFATGTGQVAVELSPYFNKVAATDVSHEQIQRAMQRHNIDYCIEGAEACHLPDGCVDLITGGQAIHWVDLEGFYSQVRRVAKEGAVLAVFGFREAIVSPEVDWLTHRFIQELVGPYWPQTSKILYDSCFKSLYFPFKEVEIPSYAITLKWDVNHLLTLYDSYSGSQAYLDRVGRNPSDAIRDDFVAAWGGLELIRTVQLPIHARVGRVFRE